MSWIEHTAANCASRGGVYCTMRRMGGCHGHACVVFCFRQDMVGLLGLAKGDRMAVMVGTGEETGKARIVVRPDGPYRLRCLGGHRAAKSLVLACVPWEGITDDKKPNVKCSHLSIYSNDGKLVGVEVELPDWAWPAVKAVRFEDARAHLRAVS